MRCMALFMGTYHTSSNMIELHVYDRRAFFLSIGVEPVLGGSPLVLRVGRYRF